MKYKTSLVVCKLFLICVFFSSNAHSKYLKFKTDIFSNKGIEFHLAAVKDGVVLIPVKEKKLSNVYLLRKDSDVPALLTGDTTIEDKQKRYLSWGCNSPTASSLNFSKEIKNLNYQDNPYYRNSVIISGLEDIIDIEWFPISTLSSKEHICSNSYQFLLDLNAGLRRRGLSNKVKSLNQFKIKSYELPFANKTIFNAERPVVAKNFSSSDRYSNVDFRQIYTRGIIDKNGNCNITNMSSPDMDGQGDIQLSLDNLLGFIKLSNSPRVFAIEDCSYSEAYNICTYEINVDDKDAIKVHNSNESISYGGC